MLSVQWSSLHQICGEESPVAMAAGLEVVFGISYSACAKYMGREVFSAETEITA